MNWFYRHRNVRRALGDLDSDVSNSVRENVDEHALRAVSWEIVWPLEESETTVAAVESDMNEAVDEAVDSAAVRKRRPWWGGAVDTAR